jgi:hypothetical protein
MALAASLLTVLLAGRVGSPAAVPAAALPIV